MISIQELKIEMMSKKYTVKNILSFLEGNIKYNLNRLGMQPEYIQEQVTYRLYQCKDDCLPNEECIICSCPPEKKAFTKKSCNPKRFGDLMNKEDWDNFKTKD